MCNVGGFVFVHTPGTLAVAEFYLFLFILIKNKIVALFNEIGTSVFKNRTIEV